MGTPWERADVEREHLANTSATGTPREHLGSLRKNWITGTPWVREHLGNACAGEHPGHSNTGENFRAGTDPGIILSVLVAQLVGRLGNDGFVGDEGDRKIRQGRLSPRTRAPDHALTLCALGGHRARVRAHHQGHHRAWCALRHLSRLNTVEQ